MENNFDELDLFTNISFSIMPLTLIKDSEKRKLMLMSVLAKELVKLNDKSFYIIL